jgi:hypothetical protein
MFQIDKSTIDYLKDLSEPTVTSSTDVEDIDLKRDIIKTNILTLILGIFVIGTMIILFIFYLPGLFNVFFQILVYYFASVISYWPLVLGGVVIFAFLFYFSLKRS